MNPPSEVAYVPPMGMRQAVWHHCQGCDPFPMAANLQRIVNNPPPNKVITFRVKTGFEEANDVLDEPNLTGFAQLSLTD